MENFFSIIIPLYNRAKYIQKAIESVLNQTYPTLELIIVDDASTDESLQQIKIFSDSRINVISLSENGGNAKARNEGWKAAKGEWIVYLDSDDWYESTYLDNLNCAINRNQKVSFFWTGVRFVNESGKILKEEIWKPKQKLPGSTFFDELRIGTNCGVAFKKEILKDLGGFDETFRASVDREFFLRISKKTQGLGIEEVLVNCLLGDHESVRKDYTAQSEAYSKMIHQFQTEIEATRERQEWWYHKAMWLALYCGDISKGLVYLKAMNFPLKSTLLFLIFSLFPLNVAKDLHKKMA